MAYTVLRMKGALNKTGYAFLLALVACSEGNGNGPSPIDATPDALPPTFPIEPLKNPETCKECHAKHYRDWSGSMHAYASDDPLFLAMNERGQREANIRNFCVNCHAPMAVAAVGPDTVVDTAMLKTLPPSQRGVTCYFCHSIDGVSDSHNNPLHLANDGVMRGRFSDAVPNEAHRSAYSEFLDGTQLQSAHACGACHDIVNGHGAHIERTFGEWKGTVFNAQKGSTCAQCHVDQPANKELIADGPKAPGVFLRYAHDHKMAAVDTAITDFPEIEAQKQAVADALDGTLQTAICIVEFGAQATITIATDNIAAGHKVPSGAAQDRQLWFEVTAFAGGKQIYQSGLVPPGTDAKDAADEDMWLIRDCHFDAQGKETHAFWETKSIDSNTLPGPVTLDTTDEKFYYTHVGRHFPRATTNRIPYPDKVVLRVWMQAFPYSVFDEFTPELKALGHSDIQIEQMRAKLAPVQLSTQASGGTSKDLVWTPEAAADKEKGGTIFRQTQTGPLPGIPAQLTVKCVTGTGMRTTGTIVAAPVHETCKP
jgi:nitrate reductase cytochrome c-type subunit